MFASESILLNSTIACLESFKNVSQWTPRDIIFTDKALYIFAKVETTGDTADYLQEEYERLDMKKFRAFKPQLIDGALPPAYFKDLPHQVGSFNQMIELFNQETQKKRLVSCQGKKHANQFLCLFNLVSSYRCYEQLFSSKSGPQFIEHWVQNYTRHKGEMILNQEMLLEKNLPALLAFARDNDSIITLAFLSEIQFSSSYGPLSTTQLIDHCHQVLKFFNGESITSIKFQANNMNNEHFQQICQSLTFQPSLITLEIVFNNLGMAALDNLAKVVFLENRQLKNIILNNNIIGSDAREKDTMCIFLEAFLVELDAAEKLDLSYNHLTDESLFPIVKYLFANLDCRVHDLNLECNSFSNYAKRTIGQAYSRCSNSSLNLKFGPLPLTHATLKAVVLKTKEAGAPAANEEASQTVDLTIRRKAAWPEGLKYLPFGKAERDQIASYVSQISKMCMKEERRKTFVEDIRDLCQQINDCPIEFPRHLLEPLFILVNDKLALAVASNNIYTLEILLDCLAMMGARNFKAEERYADLAQQAFQVGQNLMQCLNMDISDDNLLLKMLVENLRIAKSIGMRGEVIDMAMTLKALCLKLLQEMLQKQTNSDDDDDPNQQPYLLREDDAACSVYDSKYDEFVDAGYEKLGLTSDVEPNLGLHPFSTDYIKITNLNLNYTRKNLTESRKLLLEEETYAFINIYTRCQFLLSDGEHDSSKSLAFSSARDDQQLRFARLIFRYRLNLDECFEARVEPLALPQDYRRKYTRKQDTTEDKGPPTPHSSKSNSQDFKRVEDYKMLNIGVSVQTLEYSDTPLKTTLSRVTTVNQQTALKFNAELYKVQECSRNKSREKECYRVIRGIFERFILRDSILINNELFDEFYLQLYRQMNHRMAETNPGRDNTHIMLVLMTLISRCIDASASLLELLEAWLIRKAREQKQHDRLIQQILAHFKRQKFVESNEKITDKLFVDWPPSLNEIDSYNKDTRLSVQVLWPTSELQKYQVDESTTIESLLQEKVWRDKFFSKEPDKELYWLYSNPLDYSFYPQPLSREKKILKLMYRFEKDFEASENEGFVFGASSEIGHRQTISKKGGPQQINRKSSIMGAVKHVEIFQLVLLLRKRLYSYLHSMQNFKTLPLPSKNFLYHQIRYDYVEKDILKRPIISFETATILAALILKIKYQSKILRSKDNSLTQPIIKKNLDYVLPRSMKKEKPPQSQSWEVKILTCFEMENVKELSLEEAQDQFLTTLSGFDYMFGSYFIVERKPRVGFSSNFQSMQIGQGLIAQRRKVENQPKKNKLQKKGSSKMYSRSFDSDEYESSSEETSQDQTDTIVSQTESSDISSKMALQESIKDHSKNVEVFDEYFGNLTSEILLIAKYGSVLFLENRKRDKVLLEVSYTDLLYIMGKDDQLKLGIILSKRMGYAKETFDVGVELVSINSRVIAEDIIGYCQLNLLERCKQTDYLEFIKRNVIDIFNDDEGDGFKKGDNNLGLVVDDDLLMGIEKNALDNFTKKRSEPLHRRATITSMGLGQDSSMVSFDSDDLNNMNQEDSMMNDSLNTSYPNTRRLTAGEINERKIARQLGFQFRFKQKELIVYLKRHPVYTQSMQVDKSNCTTSVDVSKDSIGERGRNKSGETHSKLDAFKGLNEHTIDQIDEVSENSIKSEEMLGESSETSALKESMLSYSRLDREALGIDNDKSLPKLSVTPPSPKDIEQNIKDIPNLSAISAQKASIVEPFMSNRSIADHLRTDSLSPSPNNKDSHKVVIPGLQNSAQKSPKNAPLSPKPVAGDSSPKVESTSIQRPVPVPVITSLVTQKDPPKPVERKVINPMDFMKKLQAMNSGASNDKKEEAKKAPPQVTTAPVENKGPMSAFQKPNPLAIPKQPTVRPQDRFNLTQAIAFNSMNKEDKKSELAKRMSNLKLAPPPPPI